MMKQLLVSFLLLVVTTAFPPVDLNNALDTIQGVVESCGETFGSLEDPNVKCLDLMYTIPKNIGTFVECGKKISAAISENLQISLGMIDEKKIYTVKLYSGQVAGTNFEPGKMSLRMYYPLFSIIFHQVEVAGKEICGGFALGWINEFLANGVPATLNFLEANVKVYIGEQEQYEREALSLDDPSKLKMLYWINRMSATATVSLVEPAVRKTFIDRSCAVIKSIPSYLENGVYWLNSGDLGGGHFTAFAKTVDGCVWFDPDYGQTAVMSLSDLRVTICQHFERTKPAWFELYRVVPKPLAVAVEPSGGDSKKVVASSLLSISPSVSPKRMFLRNKYNKKSLN